MVLPGGSAISVVKTLGLEEERTVPPVKFATSDKPLTENEVVGKSGELKEIPVRGRPSVSVKVC